MSFSVQVQDIPIGPESPPVLIAGLCVIEDEAHTLETATRLKAICESARFPLIFKASFDKANRSSVRSYRGPGLEEGLRILAEVRRVTALPVLTDVHEAGQVETAARAVDVLQIPAFLCRQTDLLVAAGKTGKVVNLKKGQFLAPWDLKNAVEKIESTGNGNILLTERGSCFGYNNLVADLRSLTWLAELGKTVIMDVTHSLQVPGGLGHATGGHRELIPNLARAAAAWGCDGLFLEVHEDPDSARSDGPNTLRLETLGGLLKDLKKIFAVSRGE